MEQLSTIQKGDHHMSTEDNKALVRHFTEEIWNRGHVALLDELVDPHFVSHDPHVPVQGPEQFKQFVLMYRSAFPDASFSIEEEIAEGDQVVTRYTTQETHRGMFLGISPTGKHVTVTGITIDRFANGKLVESWNSFDTLGLLQQLGVIPTPGQESKE
jgi:steroid delta-isomerase-like uncharacterized protein